MASQSRHPILALLGTLLCLAALIYIVVNVVDLAPKPAPAVPPATRPGPSATTSESLAAVTVTPRPPDTVTPSPTPSLTPVVVTPRATGADPFAAATISAHQTEEVLLHGTPTPTPRNLVTATFTPRPVVITRTPTPGSEATAERRAALATALAFTTGTPTPFPTWVVIATPSITPSPWPGPSARPPATATPPYTPTPVMIPLAEIARWAAPTSSPTPVFPRALVGKILFQANYAGSAQPYAMNPDGSGIARLTGAWPYRYAEERDAYSADRTYFTFAEQDKDGLQRLIQIYYYDNKFGLKSSLTGFGVGTAWAPAWSPVDDLVAFVSNESGNDEIWVVRKDQLPPRQLTRNTWEWDHHPSWSPDGRQIVFSSNRSGRQQIWLMDADGANPHPLTDGSFDAWDPVWVKYAD